MKRRIIAALMCLCMLVGLLPMSAFAAPAELQPGEMTAWKSATYDPDEDTVKITLHVQGKDIEQEIPKEKPVDVVLVVDNSGSMEEQFDDQAMCPGTEEDIVHGDWLFGFWYYCSVCGRYRGWSFTGLIPPTGDCRGPMNKIAAARGAAYTLVNELAASNEANRIAVVSFESSILSGASIGLTALNSEDNLKKVTDTIEAMRANGGTNYTAALAKAQEYLSGSDREKYVIFISDGAPGPTGESYNDPDWNGVDKANALKQDGTTIYTIGLNVPGDAMSRLATEGKDRSFTNLDNLNQTLPTLIKEIVEEIQQKTTPAGRNITFVDSINTEKFTLVENQTVSGLTFDYDKNKVTWTLAETNGGDQTVSFKVKPNDSSVYGTGIQTNSSATYEYTDCEEKLQEPKAVDSATVTLPSSTLSYDLGGGTAPEETNFASVTVRTGCEVTIPNVSPEKTNQTFRYWKDKNSEDTYAPGTLVKLGSNLELIAVYTPAQASENAYFYVLKPGVDDATVTEQQNFFYVGQGSIIDNTADMTDFTGNGVQEYISELPDDDLTEIGAGAIANNVGENFSNVLWYRVKTANGANSNDSGSPIVGSGTSTRHVDGLLKPNAAHYTVLFAVKNADGSIKSIVHSATFSLETAIGEDTVNTANTAALTAEGKNANEWTVTWKDANDNVVNNVAGTSGTGGQILIFYAYFAEKTATYTLSYDANAQKGGMVGNLPDPSQHPAGASVTLSTKRPTHTPVKVNSEDAKATAVVFIGWTENQTTQIFKKGDTAPTTVASVTMIAGGKTVYAAWGYDANGNGIADATEVNVTFGAGAHGTLNGKSTTTVAKGGKLSSSQIPSVSAATNYTFTGWESSVDGKVYTNDALLTLAIGQATTFTARYEYHDPGQGGIHYDHHLYYHSNFGKDQKANESTNKDKVEVQDYKKLQILPERDGYVFVSWNTEKDGSGTRYLPGAVFDLTRSEHHLYAQWQKDKTGPDDSGVSNWLETDEHNAYLTGYPDSTFRADRNMTRAEVAQMFYALLLDKNVTITKSFSDVPDDAWYATAVKTLASLGMMDGYPDGTFRPDEPITRAEFATVGLAFAYDPFDADCSYYDVSASAWYHTYVAQATTYGWIGGYPDNTFRPGNNITRVEVCVIVNNMLGRDADERYIDRHEDELVHFVDLSDSYWGYYTIMESTNTHEYTGSFTNEKWTDVK